MRTRTGSASEIVRIPYGEAYEAGFEDMPRRVPDISKIARFVGYRPTRSLAQILDDVIAFHRESRSRDARPSLAPAPSVAAASPA